VFATLISVTTPEWGIYVVDEVRDWIFSLEPSANLKELRPGSTRILFVFDPWRSSILLVAGDKAGQWDAWYREAIPLAEQRYEVYLKERAQEEGDQR